MAKTAESRQKQRRGFNYVDLYRDMQGKGVVFNMKEFLIALLAVLGYSREDITIISQGIDLSKENIETTDGKSIGRSSSSSAQLAKPQVKRLVEELSKWHNGFIKSYISENHLVDKLYEERLKTDKQLIKQNKILGSMQDETSLKDIQGLLTRIAQEAKSRPLEDFETKELKELVMMVGQLIKLMPPDESKSNINRTIVTTYPPVNAVCNHCYHETYAVPNHVCKCMNCGGLIDSRPDYMKEERVVIYEFPADVPNYWDRNYPDDINQEDIGEENA